MLPTAALGFCPQTVTHPRSAAPLTLVQTRSSAAPNAGPAAAILLLPASHRQATSSPRGEPLGGRRGGEPTAPAATPPLRGEPGLPGRSTPSLIAPSKAKQREQPRHPLQGEGRERGGSGRATPTLPQRNPPPLRAAAAAAPPPLRAARRGGRRSPAPTPAGGGRAGPAATSALPGRGRGGARRWVRDVAGGVRGRSAPVIVLAARSSRRRVCLPRRLGERREGSSDRASPPAQGRR